jgi:hypothetical protein
MNKSGYYLLLTLSIFLTSRLLAQDSLMDLLDSNTQPVINYTTATFKSTRILDGQSIERMRAGQLDFRISHRFGRLNSGSYNLWGLDQSTIRFGLEYGITNWLMVGLGRSSFEKTYDGFLKFSPVRQCTGAREIPVSISFFASTALKTIKWPDPSLPDYYSSRLAYTYQVLIARKFSEAFSIQVTPSIVHRNLTASELDPNDLYAMGFGGRIKLSHRISLNAEYFYVAQPVPPRGNIILTNPLSLGIDIETGGHVFQLIFTNSLSMIEKGIIGETTGKWSNGDIYFGFNISRVFTIKNYNK